MASNLHKFALGEDPYPELATDYWGERYGKFPDLESALHGLFLAHPFPVALTGRREGRFMPGISLANVGAHEVVQVWSSEPAVVKRYRAALAAHKKLDPPTSHLSGHVPHDGTGLHMGLACEVHVGMIARYQTPKIAGLLTDGSAAAAAGAASPAGRMALSFTPQARSELQLRMFQSQLARVGSSEQLSDKVESMRDQLARFHEGIRLLNSYCNGANSLQHLRPGQRAPSGEPYRLFQSRVYLGEELGLIANLADMDHRSMEKVEEWLLRNDRWKKLLPYDKCILVSRICRDEKEYHGMNGFEAAYHNALNMESLVWVRDGENVWRFATDVHFEERVFPSADDASALVARIQEKIWRAHFAPADEEDDAAPWNQKTDEKPTDPADAADPVAVTWRDDAKYPTLQAFLDSEHYPPELNLSIHRRAAAAIRKNSRESMPFALLLQGLIDHRGLLNIPAGTDIFDTEQQSKYIQLVSDFSGALTDSRNAKQFAALTKSSALKPGDRIVGWRWSTYSDNYDSEAKWCVGGKRRGPFVFTVHHVEPRDPSNKHSTDAIFVYHWQLSKRWVRSGNEYSSSIGAFTKAMGIAPIPGEFVPIDLPADLALKLLDDRNWKRAHTWAIPVLAQWHTARKQFSQVNSVEPFPLKLKNADEL